MHSKVGSQCVVELSSYLTNFFVAVYLLNNAEFILTEFLEKKVYILDTQSCSPNIKVPYASRLDTAVRQISKKTTDAIRGAIGVRDGVHTFEVSFNDKPWGSHCAVGVCSSSVPLYSEGKLTSIYQ